MQKNTARTGGAHRKQDTTAKRRVTMVAVAATAVTSAGAAGAAAGSTTKADKDIVLAADSQTLAQGNGTGAGEAAAQTPQILEVPQAKEVSDLSSQLDSALHFAQERTNADLANRLSSADLSAAIQNGDPNAAGLAKLIGGFAKPAEGIFTSPFGPRWGTFHKGIDIANAVGTPILAVMDGTVIDSGPASGFGQWIRIKHDDGTITVYGHMATLDVTVGQRVSAGQKIAGMGSLGFSTGSHLHFEVHPNGGEAIDPAAWLAARGINV
ncbi:MULTISPECIES: M23 family metallopeptidase [Corynebacterium]|nr:MULTISPECIES: M23 family metallopeptidase [Corynebacterium]